MLELTSTRVVASNECRSAFVPSAWLGGWTRFSRSSRAELEARSVRMLSVGRRCWCFATNLINFDRFIHKILFFRPRTKLFQPNKTISSSSSCPRPNRSHTRQRFPRRGHAGAHHRGGLCLRLHCPHHQHRRRGIHCSTPWSLRRRPSWHSTQRSQLSERWGCLVLSRWGCFWGEVGHCAKLNSNPSPPDWQSVSLATDPQNRLFD